LSWPRSVGRLRSRRGMRDGEGEHRENRTEGVVRRAPGCERGAQRFYVTGRGMARGWRGDERRERGGARADEAAAAAVTAVATAGGARARAREYVCTDGGKGSGRGESREVGEGTSSPRCRSRVAAFDVIRSWSVLFRANVSRERDHREIRIVNIFASVRVCM